MTTGIYGVIDRAVANAFIVHHLDYFEQYGWVLLSLSIQLYIGNMPPFVIAWKGASK